MHTKIPNKSALEKNRRNLQKMMPEDYAEKVNKMMVQIVQTCRSNDLEIKFYVEKFLSNLHNDRIKKMFYLDAYYYLFPDQAED